MLENYCACGRQHNSDNSDNDDHKDDVDNISAMMTSDNNDNVIKYTMYICSVDYSIRFQFSSIFIYGSSGGWSVMFADYNDALNLKYV